jgi:hypothetical protein
MKQITIRKIPEEIEKEIRKEAKEKKLSLNKAFLSLLEKTTGAKKRREKNIYHDLDRFCGIWTEADAGKFGKSLALQRGIDEELWKQKG